MGWLCLIKLHFVDDDEHLLVGGHLLRGLRSHPHQNRHRNPPDNDIDIVAGCCFELL